MEMSATVPDNQRLEGLDALRGIAAFLVLLFHVEFAFSLNPYFQRAYLSVDFFFLLSGMVMARQYEGRFPETAAFLRKRLVRLWPVMAIGALLGTMVFAPQMPPLGAVMACLMGLLLVPWLGSDKGLFPLNPPAWSILFELFANALHAAVLHRLKTGWLLVISALCGAILLARAPALDLGAVRADAVLGFPRVVMSYALGVALWRLRDHLPRIPTWAGLLLVPAVIVVLPFMALPQLFGDLGFAVIAAPMALIAGLSPLGFGRRALVWLGWLSFPLYAVHYPVLMFMGKFTGPLPAALTALGVAWVAAHAADALRGRLTVKAAQATLPPCRIQTVPR
jgi:peptidoglycan/LPS O-acetylase OafA/YrhL